MNKSLLEIQAGYDETMDNNQHSKYVPAVGTTCLMLINNMAVEDQVLVMGYFDDLVWVTIQNRNDKGTYSGCHKTFILEAVTFIPFDGESKPDQIPQPPQRLQYRPEDVAFKANDQMCGPDAYHRINHSEQSLDMVGRKADQDKPRMDLIPPHAEKLMAEVLTFGAKKYSPENWRKVPDLTNRYTAAAMRHINDYRSGNSVDSETGIHHLAHAMCCLAFIIENDILSEVERHAESINPAPASQ